MSFLNEYRGWSIRPVEAAPGVLEVRRVGLQGNHPEALSGRFTSHREAMMAIEGYENGKRQRVRRKEPTPGAEPSEAKGAKHGRGKA